MSVDGQTGQLTGTPQQNGRVRLSLIAQDRYGNQTPAHFDLFVRHFFEQAPLKHFNITQQEALMDVPFQFDLPPGLFSDPDTIRGDTLSYSAKLDGKDLSKTWLQIDPITGQLQGTPPFKGRPKVRLSAHDQFGNQKDVSFYLDISSRYETSPILLQDPEQLEIEVDEEFSFSWGNKGFYDADFQWGDELEFSATLNGVDWEDTWLFFDPESADFSGTPHQAGRHSLIIYATDKVGNKASVEMIITVKGGIEPVLVLEQDPVLPHKSSASQNPQGTQASISLMSGFSALEGVLEGDFSEEGEEEERAWYGFSDFGEDLMWSPLKSQAVELESFSERDEEQSILLPDVIY